MQVHCCDNEGQKELLPDIDCQSIKFGFDVGASPNVRSAAREIGRTIRQPDATRRYCRRGEERHRREGRGGAYGTDSQRGGVCATEGVVSGRLSAGRGRSDDQTAPIPQYRVTPRHRRAFVALIFGHHTNSHSTGSSTKNRPDSTSGSLRRTRAGGRRFARKSLEGLCGRGIAPIWPCTFSCFLPGKRAFLVQECSV